MRDVSGITLKEGDFILVTIGGNTYPVTIKKLDESGLLMNTAPGQIPTVKLLVEWEIILQQLPGMNQMMLRRIPHPEREHIVTKGN